MDIGLAAVLLVQGRGEMSILPAVIAVPFHHSAMYSGNYGIIVITRKKGNRGTAFFYCSALTLTRY